MKYTKPKPAKLKSYEIDDKYFKELLVGFLVLSIICIGGCMIAVPWLLEHHYNAK